MALAAERHRAPPFRWDRMHGIMFENDAGIDLRGTILGWVVSPLRHEARADDPGHASRRPEHGQSAGVRGFAPVVGPQHVGPPVLNNDNGAWSGVPIRWWRDVTPDIAQPALDHHYLTMHLGGAKRIERRGEGKVEAVDIGSGASRSCRPGPARNSIV